MTHPLTRTSLAFLASAATLAATLMTGEAQAASPQPAVTYCDAGRIATEQYGGTVHSVDSDHYHGARVWEVELEGSREGRIEVKIDQQSGKIVKFEKD